MPCKACGRRFAPDRVALHEQICIKTGQKKRKQFDTMMYRVKGTDIEPFVKKGLVKKQMEVSVPSLILIPNHYPSSFSNSFITSISNHFVIVHGSK